jgi:hypothetical protein
LWSVNSWPFCKCTATAPSVPGDQIPDKQAVPFARTALLRKQRHDFLERNAKKMTPHCSIPSTTSPPYFEKVIEPSFSPKNPVRQGSHGLNNVLDFVERISFFDIGLMRNPS